KIAGQIMPDRLLVGIGIFLEQLLGHQDETGSAEAALEGAGLDESLLHGTELPVAGEMLDRRHLGAIHEGREVETTRHRAAVDQHGAAAAQALAAALARA